MCQEFIKECVPFLRIPVGSPFGRHSIWSRTIRVLQNSSQLMTELALDTALRRVLSNYSAKCEVEQIKLKRLAREAMFQCPHHYGQGLGDWTNILVISDWNVMDLLYLSNLLLEHTAEHPGVTTTASCWTYRPILLWTCLTMQKGLLNRLLC